MNFKKIIWLIVLLAGFLAGFIVRNVLTQEKKVSVLSSPESFSEQKSGQLWTCSMHPQIIRPVPGKCPICHMDLIPLSKASKDSKTPILELTEYAKKLAEVESSPVERKFVYAEVFLTGKIEYDETRFARISAHFPGRVEKLFVNYTGMTIKKGEHIAELFSPDLSVLQEEMIIAWKTYDSAVKKGLKTEIQNALDSLNAVKTKMRVWGFTEEQIKRMEERKKVSERVTLYAPVSGVVIHKNILEGQYFEKGDSLFTIADTSVMWLMMDAYESDINMIRPGQKVRFEVEAFPGRIFYGRIVYISPEVNEKTRAVEVRANVENPDGSLRSGMFVKAFVSAKLDNKGNVIEDSLAGKWISPMHPEIIKDKPGKCDICGMDLVPAESMGLVSKGNSEPPLVIPSTAPLITGKRAVVYLDLGNGLYEGKEISLGPKAGDYYVVISGLKEGDRVVTRGNFKIDSSMQIMAKPSMMSIPEGKISGFTASEDKKVIMGDNEISNLINIYLSIHSALSRDSLDDSIKKASELLMEINKPHEKSPDLWNDVKAGLLPPAEKMSKAANIGSARSDFSKLSDSLYSIIKKYDVPGGLLLYREYCPMAFDGKGAFWLQSSKKIENPYFGSSMLRCGETRETLGSGNSMEKAAEKNR